MSGPSDLAEVYLRKEWKEGRGKVRLLSGGSEGSEAGACPEGSGWWGGELGGASKSPSPG